MLDQGIPTVVAGDFNCVLRAEDKTGGRLFEEDVATREFAQFLQVNGLVDLKFVGS